MNQSKAVSDSSAISVLNAQPDDIVMGGVQMRSISVGERLEDRGIRTDILVPRATSKTEVGPVSKAARKKALRVFEFHGLYRPRAFRDFSAFLHNCRWVVSLPGAISKACSCIRKAAPDIVHVNGLLNIIPAIAAKLMRRPLLWQLIGDHYPDTLVSLLRPLVVAMADEIAFEAERMKKFYFGDRDIDYHLLHEPVDLSRFDGSNGRSGKILDEFGIDRSKTVVGSVGNISPSKGWEYFLEAVKNIEEGSNIHVIIIGAISDTQRDYAKKIKRKISSLGLRDTVTMTGYREDVEDLLGIVDIFMMASINEGTPLAILEAMGTGIPVIATDVGGVAGQIEDGRTGYVCPPRDPESLANACRRLLQDPEKRKEMGRAGRIRAENRFSLASSVDDHESLYRRMIA